MSQQNLDFDPNQSTDDLGAQIVKSLVRHWISMGAGSLVSIGALAADDQTQFNAIASGIALYALSQGWSFVRKWSAARK